MDAMIQNLWPFFAICAAVGAFAFVVSRLAHYWPSKVATVDQSRYKKWAAQKGDYTHFESGYRRFVHVSRTSIGWNLKNENADYPTCVVIDEDGNRHEFHEVFMHDGGAGSTLVYNPEGDAAKVYIVTYGRITGRRDNKVVSPKIPYNPLDEKLKLKTEQAQILYRQYDEARRNVDSLQQTLKLKDEQLRILRNDLQAARQNAENGVKEAEAIAEKGYEQAYSMITDLRMKNAELQNRILELEEEEIMEPSGDINVKRQTKRVRKDFSNSVGIADYEIVPLEKGEEGYIDVENQVRYCRVLRRNPSINLEPVSLQEGDIGYRDPNEPTPC